MIDWTRRLRAASFNGNAFYVATGDVEAGHRVSTTNVPNGSHVNESFGPAPKKFMIEAYVTGDFCAERAQALLDAASDDHAGVLVLPDSGAHQVRLTKATRKFDKDKLGYIAIQIEAVAEPDMVGTGLSLTGLASQLYGFTAALSASMALFAAARFMLAGEPAPATDAAITYAAAPLGEMNALRDLYVPQDQRASLDAPFAAAQTALAGLAADPGAYGAAIAVAATELANAIDPRAALLALFAAPAVAPAATTTPVDAWHAEGAAALQAVTRAVIACVCGQRLNFRDRDDAVAIRTDIAATASAAQARIDGHGLALARDLVGLAGAAAAHISRAAADLAPLLTVSAPARLPSLWWSYRLYGTALRADEIIARARAANPALMPQQFDALAV